MVANLSQAAARLKNQGFWLYGAEAAGDLPYYRADYRLPLVLVIGSEGKGLSPLQRKNCDRILTIPMPGQAAGSLNVSAAAAVLIYAALGQREGWFK
jgi:23S rRNA (guanosine2251-2'-O)-methyltransferase